MSEKTKVSDSSHKLYYFRLDLFFRFFCGLASDFGSWKKALKWPAKNLFHSSKYEVLTEFIQTTISNCLSAHLKMHNDGESTRDLSENSKFGTRD